jgi:hypothetical protein
VRETKLSRIEIRKSFDDLALLNFELNNITNQDWREYTVEEEVRAENY